ncbi:LOW QUALITY PROTEIN: NFX1-type zinc finger-containing protein 1-like [Haliotis rubra]|uniref:LOW QUALITY PROTEIN: NFX1-type zinc finger-containing protein 1-like n=1 Tax=Haliotis rubra TaxID=36100 RepID=UPI001EE5ACF8|nr:LOW QUALITY PROTEIN: NFX1-type zinc finger-containing protein 1-like [Haliotis rubra]
MDRNKALRYHGEDQHAVREGKDRVPQRYSRMTYQGERRRNVGETKSETSLGSHFAESEVVAYEDDMRKRCGSGDNPLLEHQTNEDSSRETSECQKRHSTQVPHESKRYMTRSDVNCRLNDIRNDDRKTGRGVSQSTAQTTRGYNKWLQPEGSSCFNTLGVHEHDEKYQRCKLVSKPRCETRKQGVADYKLPTEQRGQAPTDTNSKQFEINEVLNNDHRTMATRNLEDDSVLRMQKGMTGSDAAEDADNDSGFCRKENTSLQSLQQLKCRSSDSIANYTANTWGWFQTGSNTNNWTLESTTLIISILAKGCRSSSSENVSKMLVAVKNSNLLNWTVNNMLTEMSNGDCTREEATHTLKDLYIVLQHMSSRIPSSVMLTMGLDKHIQNVFQTITAETEIWNTDLSQEMKIFSDIKGQILNRLDNEKEKAEKQRKKIKPPDDFRTLSVFPRGEDLNMRNIPFLRKNKQHGTYDDMDEYLDIQFRLLREDFIQPLREGIQEYWDYQKDRSIRKSIKVYKGVTIKGVVWSSDTAILHTLSFDTRELKEITWENTKRLKNDTLVCISSDNFKTFINATVQQRNSEELQKGNVTVRFEIDYRASCSLLKGGPYVMIETPAYFEAYRPVLEALKCVTDDLPFTRYILKCETCTRPPLYMRYCSTPIDFSKVVKQRGKSNLQKSTRKTRPTLVSELNPDENGKVDVGSEENGQGVNDDTWPNAEDLELNESQHKAYIAALTEDFSIIQGPPGTGKTYVGLKIVETLLSNINLWHRTTGEKDVSEHGVTSPILLVCYTNHALDQFMEGISRFMKKEDHRSIVRIGGQSKSETVKNFNIMHRRLERESRRSLANIQNQLTICKRDIQKCGWQIVVLREGIIHEDVLKPFIKQHFCHLTKQFERRHCNSAILNWLGFGILTKRNKRLQSKAGVVPNPQEYYIQNRQLLETENRMFALTITDITESVSEGGDGQDEENIGHALEKLSKKQKEDILRNVQGLLNNRRSMTTKEVQNVTNIWKLKWNDRRRLYWYWVQLLQDFLETRKMDELNDKLCQFKETVTEYKNAERKIDVDILKEAKVVGMTTTGAAKNYELLELVKPRIVVIEEAAEVLESHTVTSIHPGCEHLILIGDHQQLRPNPNVYTLAKRYKLELSLFERMVNNGLRINCLTIQHRMRPCISRLMRHIYLRLEDHPKVSTIEDIKGIAKNLFFISHSEKEGNKEDSMSHFNEFEVHYLVRLCRYLLLQGYKQSQITILSAYLGQVSSIKKELPQPEFRGVNVTAVDNFQGEENDIILLSLVRSNVEEKVGFLRIENRVCVALSRAKMGMYVIGNFDLLAKKSDIWRRIISDVKQKGEIGPGLPLYCQNHSNMEGIVATKPEDFNAAPDGGCLQKCDYRLNCGHVCQLSCHPLDREHNLYECQKACLQKCPAGHPCPKPCFDKCGKCMFVVSKVMPECGHPKEGYCFVPPEKEQCQMQCEKTCARGHQCQQKCFERCRPCQIKVPQTLSKCGHQQEAECYLDPRFIKCKHDCEKVCQEGHPCKKKCHEICGRCSVLVPKILPKCGHEQYVQCSTDPMIVQCKTNCEQILPCGHTCSEWCGTKCRCKTFILKLMSCGHLKSILCDDRDLLNLQCEVKCKTNLKCGHPCDGSCFECWGGRLHIQCTKKHECMLVCGHISEIKGTYTPPLQSQLPTFCDHGQCGNKCGEECTRCNKKCTSRCPHFPCRKSCGNTCRRERCSRPCKRRLPCKHLCPGLCGEKCPNICRTCDPDEFSLMRIASRHRPSFVQLSDCGHMLDKNFLDLWMQPFFNEYGVAEIGYRNCPYCADPIRNNPRYNQILKCMQADIVELSTTKTKEEEIFQQDIERAMPQTELHHSGYFGRSRFRRKDEFSWITAQIRFSLLDDVQNIDEIIRNWDASSSHVEVINRCSEDMKYLKKWIWKLRKFFSEQETSDAEKELKRQTLLLTLLKVLEHADIINSKEENFSSTDTEVEPGSKLPDVERRAVENGIRLLRQEGPLSPRVLSKIETLTGTLYVPGSQDLPLRLHVQDIDLPKPLVFGCWFKCRNGHTFFEGNPYKKANLDEVKCPECIYE